jgi:hypothetical protein
MIRINQLTTSTLRSVDAMGGLDNYLLRSKHVGTGEGKKLKKILTDRIELKTRLMKKYPDTYVSQKVHVAGRKLELGL